MPRDSSLKMDINHFFVEFLKIPLRIPCGCEHPRLGTPDLDGHQNQKVTCVAVELMEKNGIKKVGLFGGGGEERD